MKLIEYLKNKVGKFQKGGDGNNDKKTCDMTEETLPEKFYLQHPSAAEIDTFKRIFCSIQTNPSNFARLFKIMEVLPISSANGVVIVVETKSKKPIIDNQLLVKIPQAITSDSVTYEYYVGEVLNTLRINRLTDNFALVYGLISCGFNTAITDYLRDIDKTQNIPRIEQINNDLKNFIQTENNSDLCDNKFPNKPHIIYEYIRNVTTSKTQTFDKYMSRLSDRKLKKKERNEIEMNIINLTIMIMYSLQVAQDNFDFTHYDLHTNNILVIELTNPEPVKIMYRGKNLKIMTNVIPHIIDYGRAYVNPQRAQEIINKTEYYDIQLHEQNEKVKEYQIKHPTKKLEPQKYSFLTFQSYQNELFKNKKFFNEKDKDITLDKILQFRNNIFKKIDEILKREGGSELLYSEKFNKFFILQQYTMIDKIRYDIKNDDNNEYYIIDNNNQINLKKFYIENITNRNAMIEWMSNNIYNRNVDKTDLTIMQDGNLFIKKSDAGIHSDRPNKKYDMFKLSKKICNKMTIINNNLKSKLKYINIWSDLDKQLDLEYPFFDNTYMNLPCDYHVTDFFAISDANINKFTGTYIKEPKNVAEYLVEYLGDNIRSIFPPTDIMDIEHVFQIVSEE
jgi:hypothetical protein